MPICLAALAAGALNTLGSFALPASIPVALNVIWIAALTAAQPLGFTVDTEVATFAAWSLLGGGAVQLLIVLARCGDAARSADRASGFPSAALRRSVLRDDGADRPRDVAQPGRQPLGQLLAYCAVAPGAACAVYLSTACCCFRTR